MMSLMTSVIRGLLAVTAMLCMLVATTRLSLAVTAQTQEKPVTRPAAGKGVTKAAAAGEQPVARRAPATSAAVDIPIPDIPYTRFTLRNGLTVLVHEDHKTPVVAVNTWYHVGSKNEN